jgi:predicted choloylglycine hydrolase
VFHRLHDRFTILNDNTPLTDNKASSKKMKRQTKMISIIRNSLNDSEKLKKFNAIIDIAFGLTQKKRFYISDYGYGNVREVILGEQDKLIPGQNWDKFHLDNITSWWKRKATKRYETLKKENRFRDKVELWTEDNNIQIIR